MNIGDRFWVADYYDRQDGLVEFKVVGLLPDTSWPGWVKYEAVRIDPESTHIHFFGDNGSPNVFSAIILKTQDEVNAHYAKMEDYEERRAKAMAIFPEGFE